MDNEQEKEIDQSKPQCTCQGECTCGNKYRRPIYYEVDIKQYVETLNDWD